MNNWYKHSKSINIPNDIMGTIESLVPMISVKIKQLGKYYYDETKIKVFDPKGIFIQTSIIDPYTKGKKEIKITFQYESSIDELSGVLRVFSTISYNLCFLIPADNINQLDFNDDDIRNILIHEIWHIIDPKTIIDDKKVKVPRDAKNYYTDKKEIDAYQTDIIAHIIKGLKDKTISIDYVKMGLTNNIGDWLSQLGIGYLSRKAYRYWLKNDLEAIKLFKKRLYSAISDIQVTANWYRKHKYASFISDFPRVESLYVIKDAILGLHELNYKYDLISNEYIGMKNKARRIGWEYFVHCREFIDKVFNEWLELHELSDKNLDMSDEDLEEFESGEILIKIGRQILVAKERLDKINYNDNLSNMCMAVNLCLGVAHSNGLLLKDYGDSSIDLDFLDKLHSHDYYSVWKKELEEELS